MFLIGFLHAVEIDNDFLDNFFNTTSNYFSFFLNLLSVYSNDFSNTFPF